MLCRWTGGSHLLHYTLQCYKKYSHCRAVFHVFFSCLIFSKVAWKLKLSRDVLSHQRCCYWIVPSFLPCLNSTKKIWSLKGSLPFFKAISVRRIKDCSQQTQASKYYGHLSWCFLGNLHISSSAAAIVFLKALSIRGRRIVNKTTRPPHRTRPWRKALKFRLQKMFPQNIYSNRNERETERDRERESTAKWLGI